MAAARQSLKAGQTDEAKHEWMKKIDLNAIIQREDMMRITLAPFLQGTRWGPSAATAFPLTCKFLAPLSWTPEAAIRAANGSGGRRCFQDLWKGQCASKYACQRAAENVHQ